MSFGSVSIQPHECRLQTVLYMQKWLLERFQIPGLFYKARTRMNSSFVKYCLKTFKTGVYIASIK